MCDIYLSRKLAETIKSQDENIEPDSFYLQGNLCYKFNVVSTDNFYYDPSLNYLMNDGCVMAFFPRYGSKLNPFRFCAEQHKRVFKWEGEYLYYKECDFLKIYGGLFNYKK